MLTPSESSVDGESDDRELRHLLESVASKEERRVTVGSVSGSAEDKGLGLVGVKFCAPDVSPSLDVEEIGVDSVCHS